MSLICPFSPGVGELSNEIDEDACGKIIRMKPLNLTNLDMAKPHRVLFEPLYHYMRNFCNLIGLEQWYFSLI